MQHARVVCEAERVVVKLNRAARPGERLVLLGIVGGASAVALGLFAWLARSYVHPAAALLVWIAFVLIAAYTFTVEVTLVATPGTGAFVEHRGPLGRRSKLVVCPPGEALSIEVREKIDLESDLRPFTGHEIAATTSRGPVVLCTAGTRQGADDLARSLARVLVSKA
jgi:hypothetical protein